MAALSEEMKVQSFLFLRAEYGPLEKNQDCLLEEINALAAEDGVLLSGRTPIVKQFIINEIKKKPPQSVDFIDDSMKAKEKQDDAQQNPSIASALVGFHSSFLNQRGTETSQEQSEWMQDHDMTRIMPTSYLNIAVTAPICTGKAALVVQTNIAIKEAVLLLSIEDNIKHIIIPVGPGHWRGIYLTKPEQNQTDSKYKLEIFDSFGSESARKITDFVLEFLDVTGVTLTPEYKGPSVNQADGYSCGDYVCAYSHQKMKEFGATKEAYNQDLIDALQAGNANHSLRKATLQVFDGMGARRVSPAAPINTTTHALFVNQALFLVLAGIALALVLIGFGAISMIAAATVGVVGFVGYALLRSYRTESTPVANTSKTAVEHSHQTVFNALGVTTPTPAASNEADQSHVQSIDLSDAGSKTPQATTDEDISTVLKP